VSGPPGLARDDLGGVAADAAGNFVVAWASSYWGDGTQAVLARRFDALGVPFGPPFQVSGSPIGHAQRSDVASDAAGAFVVVWVADFQDGDESGISARRYDSGGAALDPEFQVNTYTTGSQGFPHVASGPGGSFVVVWTGFGGQDGSGTGVFAQRFDSNGMPQGGEFQVNTYTTGDQGSADVAIDTSGNFILVWGRAEGVFAQRYDSTGIPQGGEFQVDELSSPGIPAVASGPGGNVLVAWRSSGGPVYARRYDSAGVPQGGEFQVTASGGIPSVAADGAGNFLISWFAGARLYDAAGVPQGPEFLIGGSAFGFPSWGGVAAGPAGTFVVTGARFFPANPEPARYRIIARRITAACGDGVLQPGETCDDGGNADGDGCAASCTVESCYACAGEPSGCAPVVTCAHADGCCLPGCEASTDDDCPAHVTGRTLSIKDQIGGRRIIFISRDPAIDTTPGTGIEPLTDGASFHVYNASTGDSDCYELLTAPPAGWESQGSNPAAPTFLYRDRESPEGKVMNGACFAARVKDGKLLKVQCRSYGNGSGVYYSLDEPAQGSIAVRFKSGGKEYCAVFGGTVRADQQGGPFRAVNAPAPAICPVPPGPCP
jgi:cysteine-rich repeat protein